jgi:hypothetical protein
MVTSAVPEKECVIFVHMMKILNNWLKSSLQHYEKWIYTKNLPLRLDTPPNAERATATATTKPQATTPKRDSSSPKALP